MLKNSKNNETEEIGLSNSHPWRHTQHQQYKYGSEMQTLYCLRIKNEAVSDA